jgi:hypothetical protein
MHIRQRRIGRGFIDDGNASRTSVQSADRIDRAGIIGAVDARMHNHHALDMQRGVQRLEIVKGGRRRRIGARRRIRKGRLEDVDVAIAGFLRHVEIRRRMGNAKNNSIGHAAPFLQGRRDYHE